MTSCFVFHYNLASGNILFHVNINKGRFDLTQKFQLRGEIFSSRYRRAIAALCKDLLTNFSSIKCTVEGKLKYIVFWEIHIYICIYIHLYISPIRKKDN